MKRFWKLIARFAYKRWVNACGSKHFPEVGMPGQRDPKARCARFQPLPYPPHVIRGNAHRGACVGDGHYLCKECAWYAERVGG